MDKFTTWMKLSTTKEKKLLAKFSKTNHIYLYQLAVKSRIADSDLAIRIAKASKKLFIKSKHHLPLLTPGDLSPVCKACPYFKKCRGKI